ncbi:MAG: hypothetical protein WDA75_22945 [Candidatus Latescibacterota bacterium]|jgi:hypothetical protein
MTRRERLEAKAEKLQEWAQLRRDRAKPALDMAEHFHGDIAFNTQPGHIPLRARLIASEDRAYASISKAGEMDSRAAGIAHQLDHSVFSDDDNAIEALEARIAEREAQRDRMKRVNSLFRKGDATGLAALGLNLETLRAEVAKGYSWDTAPYVSWQLTNLGATIRTDKQRIEEIKRRQQRTEQAEANGGVTIEGNEYVRVTFAEKPARFVLDALKAAGFHWGSGSWVGKRENLPELQP